MTDEIFRLYPPNPDTETRVSIVTERPQRDSLTLNVESWRRVLPNKNCVQLDNKDGVNYQCTALDAYSCIEARITFRLNGKGMSAVLTSSPVQLSRQLREKLLYEPEPVKAAFFMEGSRVSTALSIFNKRLRFVTQFHKYQLNLNEHTLELDSNPTIMKVNLHNNREDFLRFYSDCLKMGSKSRANFAIIIFASKLDRDTIAAQAADCFQPAKSAETNQITIIGTTTPRNDTTLKNDHSASSLTSANRSRHKEKKKIKISERLNLKKSYTKLTPNRVDSNSQHCLNIFEEDGEFPSSNPDNKGQESFFNDTSMDLRGSFEQLEQQHSLPKREEDLGSDSSFRQKKGAYLNPIDQENKRLREENNRLRQEMESMANISKEFAALKKKYAAVVEENTRLENERRAIIKDKVKFQSNYHKEAQEKEMLRAEVDNLKAMLGLRRP